jgi:hypothetical protein
MVRWEKEPQAARRWERRPATRARATQGQVMVSMAVGASRELRCGAGRAQLHYKRKRRGLSPTTLQIYVIK